MKKANRDFTDSAFPFYPDTARKTDAPDRWILNGSNRFFCAYSAAFRIVRLLKWLRDISQMAPFPKKKEIRKANSTSDFQCGI